MTGVYYKFKSARDYSSIPILGDFISVSDLKGKISEVNRLSWWNSHLILENPRNNEEYLEESTLIPKYTSVIVRRTPGMHRMPNIVVEKAKPKSMEEKGDSSQSQSQSTVTTTWTQLSQQKSIEENKVEALQANCSCDTTRSSSGKLHEELDLDDFGEDIYAIPKVLPTYCSNPVVDVPFSSETDEDSRIRALVNTPALNWQWQTQKDVFSGRGNRIGTGGRTMGGLGYGRAGMDQMTPPQGYVCHRCKISGHFIRDCPTNGDPNYDFKRLKPTSHPVVVVNEAAFEKEIGVLSSTKSVTKLPPELHCPICKEVMVDAMLTRRCCFSCFCDRCIRNHILSKSVCFCGAANVLADDLLPNLTVRATIDRLLGNSGHMKIQGSDSTDYEQCKVLSSTISFASSGDRTSAPKKDETLYIKAMTDGEDAITNVPQSSVEAGTDRPVNLQKDNILKKKRKKTHLPVKDMYHQWSTPPNLIPGDCVIPFYPSACQYGANIPLGMDGYIAYYHGAMSHSGYPAADFNVPVIGSMFQGSLVGLSDSLSHQSFGVSEHSHHSNQFHQTKKSSTEQDRRLFQYQNHEHHHSKAATDRKRKSIELSSTTFDGQDLCKKELLHREAGDPNKKKKLLCSAETLVSCGQRDCRSTLNGDRSDNDDDDDRNFKRKSSWYQSSPSFQERSIPV